MNNSDLKNEALKNILNSSTLKSFSIAEYEFEKLNGWIIIGMLLLEAKNSLTTCEKAITIQGLTQIEELTVSNALFKNFILSYSKCFSSSGKGRISLDPNDIYSERQDLKMIHLKIIETRNKYAGHNDDENGFDLGVSLINENDKEIVLAQTYTSIIPYGDFKSFQDAIEYFEYKVIIKLNKIIDKLEAKVGKKIFFK